MLKAGTDTGSLMNHIMSDGVTAPEVGMGATILYWTDRKAVTIIEVKKNKKGEIKELTLQEDTAIRTDYNGESESQRYCYAQWSEGRKYTARLLKHGWRILEGKDGESGRNIYGSGLAIGVRNTYHDYSF